MRTVLSLFVALSLLWPTTTFSYQLDGMENDLGHGLAGYAGVIASYGVAKFFFTRVGKQSDEIERSKLYQDPNGKWRLKSPILDKSLKLEERIVLQVFATLVTTGVLVLKEIVDNDKCLRSSGGSRGCFDVGAIGYGMIGVGAANATILMFEF